MYLPQSIGKDTYTLYALFKARTQKKSIENRSNVAKNPVAMILNFNHPKIDTQMGVLVKKDSFKVISENDIEVGFKAKVGCAFGNFTLYVYSSGKAYLQAK